jgi:hypothetical protein
MVRTEVSMTEVAEGEGKIVKNTVLDISVFSVSKMLQLRRIMAAIHARSDLA